MPGSYQGDTAGIWGSDGRLLGAQLQAEQAPCPLGSVVLRGGLLVEGQRDGEGGSPGERQG